MKRRNFLKTAGITTGTAALLPYSSVSGANNFLRPNRTEKVSLVKISKVEKPLAISMWDFSWILRHHKYGEFQNWDKVLEELAERGYNAIRMDAMPQFVAADENGKVIEEYRSPKKDWTPALWGNDYSMSFRPREALLEFLPKCKKYGIQVGLAS